MSRRASFFAKQNPGVRRVRFPDEVVFEECIKESDGETLLLMLRRTSIEIDVNRVYMTGMTALHQAVLDDNLLLVRLLLLHGADINLKDEDGWTPLHAATANSHVDIIRHLLEEGADPEVETDEGETVLDLVGEDHLKIVAGLLRSKTDTRDQNETLWVEREESHEDTIDQSRSHRRMSDLSKGKREENIYEGETSDFQIGMARSDMEHTHSTHIVGNNNFQEINNDFKRIKDTINKSDNELKRVVAKVKLNQSVIQGLEVSHLESRGLNGTRQEKFGNDTSREEEQSEDIDNDFRGVQDKIRCWKQRRHGQADLSSHGGKQMVIRGGVAVLADKER